LAGKYTVASGLPCIAVKSPVPQIARLVVMTGKKQDVITLSCEPTI
jgi:hypothetical protein